MLKFKYILLMSLGKISFLLEIGKIILNYKELMYCTQCHEIFQKLWENLTASEKQLAFTPFLWNGAGIPNAFDNQKSLTDSTSPSSMLLKTK
jgi:hypothetical protein